LKLDEKLNRPLLGMENSQKKKKGRGRKRVTWWEEKSSTQIRTVSQRQLNVFGLGRPKGNWGRKGTNREKERVNMFEGKSLVVVLCLLVEGREEKGQMRSSCAVRVISQGLGKRLEQRGTDLSLVQKDESDGKLPFGARRAQKTRNKGKNRTPGGFAVIDPRVRGRVDVITERLSHVITWQKVLTSGKN